jgi:hypothetical protein
LQCAPDFLPLFHGGPDRRQSRPLLGREILCALEQLLELGEPEALTYSFQLMGPQKIADPRGHF